MRTENSSKSERRRLFEAAVGKQTAVMVGNILGRGLDIPLLGLRQAAEEMGQAGQKLFSCKAYKEVNTFRLSTSQV